jgi:hypothetical protein
VKTESKLTIRQAWAPILNQGESGSIGVTGGCCGDHAGPSAERPVGKSKVGESFGSRFDDPEATYRVLDASSHRLGLARFRPDLSLLAELTQIEGEDDFPQLGQVPQEWAETRAIGSAFHYGTYADVYFSDWIGILRRDLTGFCVARGIPELDAGALQQPTSRPLTQRVSRVVVNSGFDGIHCRSRFGHDVGNWARVINGFGDFRLKDRSLTVAAQDTARNQRARDGFEPAASQEW